MEIDPVIVCISRCSRQASTEPAAVPAHWATRGLLDRMTDGGKIILVSNHVSSIPGV